MIDETANETPQELHQQATLAAHPVEPHVDVGAPATNAKNTATMTPPRQQAALAAPEPKKRGRPHGSKDTVKRTRKTISVRIEPLDANPPVQPRVATPRPEPAPVVETKAPIEIEEPETPRTRLRETSRQLVSLRALVHNTKKVERAEKLTQGWATWPLV